MISSKPRQILLLTFLLTSGYILIVGPEVFSTESLGTLILSPNVYASLLPDSLGHPLVVALYRHPILNLVLCGVPVLMLLGALIMGAFAFHRNSLALALCAFGLILTVFTVYHFIQPMGFRVID